MFYNTYFLAIFGQANLFLFAFSLIGVCRSRNDFPYAHTSHRVIKYISPEAFVFFYKLSIVDQSRNRVGGMVLCGVVVIN